MAGCTLISRAEPPAADLTGIYAGVLRIDADEIPASIQIEQQGASVRVRLQAEVGLAASGAGRLEGTVFRAELDYGEDCPGTLELAGQALDAGQRLVGTVEVQDCTGPASGSFSVARR